ncbi:aldo/keto reductase [Gluconobacter sphaericus]|uniref:aldo/keto reductase n=1 Tax=Gluconobacter sphaericus TaxID=574987 RepID=UPI001B8B7E0B|nr:aldo/keto reductase [Gluconobacter sphaericus]MBS1097977.1 aldo/keto reductase [Gluconobacter sphaericus]
MTEQPIIPLGRDVAIPQLGLGVWQTPADQTADVVKCAIAAGYRAVDTAAIYGNEEGVGTGLEGHPETFLTTKLWNTDQGFDKTLRAFDVSSHKLGRASVDLYLIHWPAPRLDLYVESWKAMIRLRDEGRVRAIGVSNFTQTHLERIIGETGVTPTLNQIELHPEFQQHSLRSFHASKGIHTQSWSPLGQGRTLNSPIIEKIAAKHSKSPAQIIIRWHLQSDLIVIPKSVTPSRIAENIDVFDFTLDATDMEQIAAMDRPDGRIGPDPLTADF